ncbi:hypothetical protein JKL49_04160 [Phenylobacterium sp. 20VBR1]|uniref:Uncharacterized protein n=1 Tax=Phenylobacterium glaciei TaxID=2803784 RepID=A0A941HVU9_9CAUL|nr:hypothetical protein [Phenylobacterium glaciei]MBR7618572.1 hypothetical protein [Phenylobacterium glaciei]
MKHPLESDAERAFELLKQTTEHGVRQGVQLGTWLVVGNGGGLVLTMQAIIQTNSSAATHLLQPAAYSFALGVVLAFSAAIITYVAWIAAVSWMTLRYDGLAGIAAADFIEREGVIIEEGSETHQLVERSKQRAGNTSGALWTGAVSGAAVALLLASGICFAAGVYGPLKDIQVLQSQAVTSAKNSPRTEPERVTAKPRIQK